MKKDNLKKELLEKELEELDHIVKYQMTGLYVNDTKLLQDYLSSHDSRILTALKELLARMDNPNEMKEMEGVEYTMGYQKALSDLLSKLEAINSSKDECGGFHEASGQPWTPCGNCGKRRDEAIN